MKRVWVLPVFIFVSLCSTACDLDDDVRFDIISEGSFSGINTKVETVIDSQSEWEDLWENHTSRQSPKPALPSVDFGVFVIVAIFAGDKPDSCYKLFLREVSQDDSEVNIKYEIAKTSEGGCAAVLTQPFTMIRLLKPEGSIHIMEQ